MTNSSNVCFVFGNLSNLKYSSDFGTSRSKKNKCVFLVLLYTTYMNVILFLATSGNTGTFLSETPNENIILTDRVCFYTSYFKLLAGSNKK